jgi:hypothetical protein
VCSRLLQSVCMNCISHNSFCYTLFALFLSLVVNVSRRCLQRCHNVSKGMLPLGGWQCVCNCLRIDSRCTRLSREQCSGPVPFHRNIRINIAYLINPTVVTLLSAEVCAVFCSCFLPSSHSAVISVSLSQLSFPTASLSDSS